MTKENSKHKQFTLMLLSVLITAALCLTSGCGNSKINNSDTATQFSDVENITSENNNNNSNNLKITFIDVGQGDSALVQCQNHYMLIDGGNAKQSQKLYSILDRNSITYLDYVIITHTDADHCGGVPGALQKADVGKVYCSDTNADTKTWNNVVKAVESKGKQIEIPQVNSKISIGKASITFLAPIQKSSEDNNNSLVTKIEYGNNKFLFTGDAEADEENDLIKNNTDLSADVLKVSHHGSRKCTSSKFLNQVNPKYAVISVGKNNYGHPSDETIKRLESKNSKIYRTDTNGDITIVSDGKELNISVSTGV